MENVTEFVKARTKVTQHGPNAKLYSFEPGNGRRYEVLIIPMSNFGMGSMGYINNGYLVVNGWNGMSALMSADAFLMDYYVGDRLFKENERIDPHAYIVTALLGFAMNMETNIETIDKFGPLEGTEKEIFKCTYCGATMKYLPNDSNSAECPKCHAQYSWGHWTESKT